MKKIPLNTKRNRSTSMLGLFALVDDDDYGELSKYDWSCSFNKHFNGPGYATRNVNGSTIGMHRQIMQAPPRQFIDHIDRNPLNNQRSNLRFVTDSQSLANRGRFKNSTSKFKGVYRDKKTGLYRLSIVKNFESEDEAAKAYNECAKILFGEYAVLNPE